MQSTNALTIKWTLRGKPKNPFFSAVGGELIVRVVSQFVLNQISGQVLEHVESWDLSGSSAPAQAYFWFSRRVYSTVEGGKDTIEAAKGLASRLSQNKDENLEVYPDPSGDPTKVHESFINCMVLTPVVIAVSDRIFLLVLMHDAVLHKAR
jgi:hypothetical protein